MTRESQGWRRKTRHSRREATSSLRPPVSAGDGGQALLLERRGHHALDEILFSLDVAVERHGRCAEPGRDPSDRESLEALGVGDLNRRRDHAPQGELGWALLGRRGSCLGARHHRSDAWKRLGQALPPQLPQGMRGSRHCHAMLTRNLPRRGKRVAGAQGPRLHLGTQQRGDPQVGRLGWARSSWGPTFIATTTVLAQSLVSTAFRCLAFALI